MTETSPPAATTPPAAAARSPWRSVAIPNEHGGWGLTLEPVLLGLLVAPSLAGVLLGVAAFLAFLVRTPLKLLSIDRRHHRWVERSRWAARIATIELALIGLLGVAALLLAGWVWLVPVALAAPLVIVEWSYDSRGRGRRLIPELTGAAGIAAVAATIVLAGDGSAHLAVAVWMILAARAIGSIPFVRVQIARLRRGTGNVRGSDFAQLAAVLVAAVAAIVEPRVALGATAIAVMAGLQTWWVRTAPVAPRKLGFTQLGLGLGVTLVTGFGALVA